MVIARLDPKKELEEESKSLEVLLGIKRKVCQPHKQMRQRDLAPQYPETIKQSP